MKTETFDDPAAFLAAVQGRAHRRSARHARDTRPDIPRPPRAVAGAGDRAKDLDRLARVGWTIYHYQAGVHELRHRDGRTVAAATYRACLDGAIKETP